MATVVDEAGLRLYVAPDADAARRTTFAVACR